MSPVVCVTGAAKRVGRAIADRFAAEGCDVVITYNTSRGPAERAAESWRAAGRRALAVPLPMDSVGEIETGSIALAERIDAEFGRLDALVHNASAYHPTPLSETTADAAQKLYLVNALAPLVLSARCAPLLARTEFDIGSAVICMADIHAMGRPRKDFAAYSMSKAALVEMVRSLARDLAPKTRVAGIAPGVVKWPDEGYESDEAAQRAYLDRVPLARSGTPEDAAEAVRWLALEAAYCTGVVLPIDGGRRLV